MKKIYFATIFIIIFAIAFALYNHKANTYLEKEASDIYTSEINTQESEALKEEDSGIYTSEINTQENEVLEEENSGIYTSEINTQKNETPKENSTYKLDSDLCAENEKLIYSFKFMDSEKTLTVAMSEDPDYLVCRIGTKDQIDLEFPEDKSNSWEQFKYRYYNRGGGAENNGLDYKYLIFQIDDIIYQIYYTYDAVKEWLGTGIFLEKEGEGPDGMIENMKGDLKTAKGYMRNLYETKIDKQFN